MSATDTDVATDVLDQPFPPRPAATHHAITTEEALTWA